MYVSKATPHDLPAIRHLLATYGSKMVITEAHINKRDIALQARSDEGELIGFLYVGLMAKNTIGYMDLFCVDARFAKQGVGNLLAHAMKDELLKRKVKSVFGIIRHDKYHDKSALNALKMAIGADSVPYTYVRTDVSHAVAELNALGGNHGR